jgi:hypothetical protein
MFLALTCFPCERPTNTERRACTTTLRNTTTFFFNKRYRILLFRFFAIIYILNFYLARAGVVSTSPQQPQCLSARTLFAGVSPSFTTTTLSFSN